MPPTPKPTKTTLPKPDTSKSGPYDERRKTIGIIAEKPERSVIIKVKRLKTGRPKIIVGWKSGLIQRTRVAAVWLIRHRIIRPLCVGILIIRPRISRGLLIKRPVTTGKRRRDQDKLNAFGLFHLGLAFVLLDGAPASGRRRLY
jgi:hypothetical protein